MRLPRPNPTAVVSGLGQASSAARLLARTGVLAPVRPDRLVAMSRAFLAYGTTLGAAVEAGAARHPDRCAVLDESGETTYAELDRWSNVLAHQLAERGVGDGRVGLLARNSAEFVAVVGALSKLGVTVVYLNTGFAGPSLAHALDDERVTAVVYDDEFAGLLTEALPGRVDVPTSSLSRYGDERRLPKPASHGGQIILTSGTTGRAKGAQRDMPSGLAGLEPMLALLDAIPFRAGEPTVIAAPMFHTWGFAHLGLGLALGSTLVVRRSFDAEGTLEDIERSKATALVVVPVMLQRMLELSDDVSTKYDVSSLRAVAVSGSALPVDTARRFAERYADAIYNLYGSTEVAYATVAAPDDMRAAPGTVGRPLRGGTVAILDDEGKRLPQGEVGRIFVGNPMTFAGYTSGGDKQRVDGLVATGDVGRFDEDGRLFIEGRDDDMVISGGENIFPGQVEELLVARPEIADVAVVGVPDEDFGARLVAHVVARDGAEIDSEAIRKHVRDNLGRIYVPREVIVHDELPRNATGKVVKRELR